MTDLVKELIGAYTIANPATKVIANFGPSGGLAKQIEQGAPADIYISANRTWMTYLVDKGCISPGSERIFANNSLVFIGRSGAAARLEDLVNLQRIGIGSPRSVPAGQYAAQALQAAGIYAQLQNTAKLVIAKDVRQALIYAERGETDGSFVYASDAQLASAAIVLFVVPPGLYDQIVYPLGLTPEGANNPAARRFAEFIVSAAAREMIVKHGFTLPTPRAK